MSKDPDMRIGEPERGAAQDQLSELFTQGYLDVTEFDERTQAAVAATHQRHIDILFVDLPSRELETATADDAGLTADAELDRVLARGKKVELADSVIWATAMIFSFLGLFVFDWAYFWVVFPIAGVASLGIRAITGLNDDDEEIYEELGKQQKDLRAERLRIAMRRRKELGH